MSNELKSRKKEENVLENVQKSKKVNFETKASEPKPQRRSKLYKYGPLPKFDGQRLFTRLVTIAGILLCVWYYSKGGTIITLAKHDNLYKDRRVYVGCDKEYIEDIRSYTGCIPKKCGRFVSDIVVTESEADILLQLAKRGMSYGGSNGGATVMDLHSGALSRGDGHINFYKTIKKQFISSDDLKTYQLVREKIQNEVAKVFEIDPGRLYFTFPSFFSRLTNKNASQVHDEYWHVHVDKQTYESFHYTSLLYLNDYGQDFKGGRFIYLDTINNPRKNMTVEPRKGRVSMFTSGAENPHFVEKVTEGERFALTISFTCDDRKKLTEIQH